MAEINLLKNPTAEISPFKKISGAVVKILAILVLAVIGYYIFLFFEVKSKTREMGIIQTSINESKKQALEMEGREEFLSRQEQLKEFATLADAHLYYSSLVTALAKVTLKNAYYNGISLTNDGKLNLQVVVPTLEDLDKFLQVFDQPEIAQNFYNVHLAGFSKNQDQEGTVYTFNVQMDYNPGIFAKTP